MTRRAAGETAGVKDQFTGRGMVVITASDAMQYSFEGGRQVGEPPGPSPFTQAFVDGLRTGEADRNEDGQVSINELFDFLEDRVRETSPSQTPTKSAVNQTGDWVIARSTRVPSVKLLPERVQLLLKSGEAIDRLEAIIDLERIRSSPDKRTAQAATAAIQTLTNDDSRRVAQRALQALGNEPSLPTATAPAVVAIARAAPVHEIANRAEVQPVFESSQPAAVPGQAGPSPFALDIARAVARAILGSLTGVALALLVAVKISTNSPGSTDIANTFLWTGGTSLVVAFLIELLRLLLPLRNLRGWMAIWANRWAEAAIVGVAAGIVATPLTMDHVQTNSDFVSIMLLLMASLAIGFVIAEAIVGLARPHAAAGSAAK